MINKLSIKKIDTDFKNGILLHGGGWKKLEKRKLITNYSKKIKKKINLSNVFNYYGMIEQTGSIFLECKFGFFHTTIFQIFL